MRTENVHLVGVEVVSQVGPVTGVSLADQPTMVELAQSRPSLPPLPLPQPHLHTLTMTALHPRTDSESRTKLQAEL